MIQFNVWEYWKRIFAASDMIQLLPLIKYILIQVPSSCDAESGFSTSGWINDIRTGIGDQSLDQICFIVNCMKAYGFNKIYDQSANDLGFAYSTADEEREKKETEQLLM